jgi:hypothetical protein
MPAKLAVFISAPKRKKFGFAPALYPVGGLLLRVRNRPLCFPKTISCRLRVSAPLGQASPRGTGGTVRGAVANQESLCTFERPPPAGLSA